ncbi:adenylate/guanylate cyclase domain-containing protein [Paraglaciecola aestuariivivens]
MLNLALKAWVHAGLSPQRSESINPIRLTNITALLVIFVSLLQLPTAFYFSNYSEILIVALVVLALLWVPVLNRQHAFHGAKYLLISVYVLDIFVSCLLWKINLNIHYFFLLAVFICPFLFAVHEKYPMLLILVGLSGLFVGFEIWFYFNTLQHTLSLHQQIFSLSCASLFALACILCSYHLWKNVNRSWQKLAFEKERSEKLLLNILPASIAQRLKGSPAFIADYFSQASILFADIQNFTPLCKQLSPHQLVDLLNQIFCVFDSLSQKYGLEKIKTSGDGYMVAGGLPTKNASHAKQCCYCALEMQSAFKTICQQHHLHTGLRIGIGCGEVIAGIIGKNKFSYDLWGEAVNLASRMESHGLCNKIQTTEATYKLTKEFFCYDKRGGIEVKGVGKVTTYWLLGIKQQVEKHEFAQQL